jgi:RNA polymerase sigma-70 factor (ECF subfamily)
LEQTILSTHQQMVDYLVSGQADFYRLAFSYVKNRDAALDVVQESIVKALSKSDTLRETAYLKTWFYRILLNESMNYFRRGRRLVPFPEQQEEPAAPDPDVGERLDLYDAIDRLSLQEQAVIRLRFFEDMKLEEIAQATGANLNTVKSRLYKSLRKLREWTGEELSDE